MNDTSPIYQLCLSGPLGDMLLTASASALLSIRFDGAVKTSLSSNSLLEETSSQLTAYFTRKLRVFDIPLDPGGTDFQQSVWRQLQHIPFGEQISYGNLSKRMNQPLAIRAIAAANGKNPLPVIIPCHRVVGRNGELVGYSGGLWRKQFLLELEGNPMF